MSILNYTPTLEKAVRTVVADAADRYKSLQRRVKLRLFSLRNTVAVGPATAKKPVEQRETLLLLDVGAEISGERTC